jgi:23S rRNA (guanosine2251-2'-O)-methyltransferase
VRSMHNVGSVFRTSDAFLVEKIYLCGFTPTPPHREIQKTALGATETVAWEAISSTSEIIRQLKENGYHVYAVEQTHNSISLDAFIPSKKAKIALVFGNEADGVNEEVIKCCDGAIEIPQFGSKHSFNISVSAGIVLWDIFNKSKTV